MNFKVPTKSCVYAYIVAKFQTSLFFISFFTIKLFITITETKEN